MRRASTLRKRSRKQKAGVRNISNKSNNEKKNLQAVLMYERSPDKTRKLPKTLITVGERIGNLIDAQSPLTAPLVVWRGQYDQTIDPNLSWFSTSLRSDVARSYSYRYVFKIHLQPGNKIINMYKYYDTYGIKNPAKEANDISKYLDFNFKNNRYFTNNDYTQFQEVLVEKGGSFWKDPEKTQKGFRWIGKAHPTEAGTFENIHDIEMDVYETYYFPA